MSNVLAAYAHWLHLRWPAGRVEHLPMVGERGDTRLEGVYVVGDLAGVPLLKFALDTGAKAAKRCAQELRGSQSGAPDGDQKRASGAAMEGLLDVAIIGAGVAGMAAAIECAKQGLRFAVLESAKPFATIANFPAGKPIFTYPRRMTPDGHLQVGADVKEALIAELERQVAGFDIPVTTAVFERIERRGSALAVIGTGSEPLLARRVIVAIGRSGNFRRLGVAGEDLHQVSNRLHDPKVHAGEDVVVVGGGDSALEAAIALCTAGAKVTLSYRGAEFSRPKPENAEAIARLATASTPGLTLKLGSTVTRISAGSVELSAKGGPPETVPAAAVYVLIGREPPLDFFRKSGLAIRGETGWSGILGLVLFATFACLLYGWKSLGWANHAVEPTRWVKALDPLVASERNPLHWAVSSAHNPSFWVTLLYTSVVVGFGIARIRRRRTPYVTAQTISLMAFQCLPLFLLPEIILPWMNACGWIPHAMVANLFPDGSWWRAYGFILAWPLMAWNLFTDQPMWWWLGISIAQTLVIIPLIVWKWGKGAYCGWICSCGALAETLGDTQREKMPHGPGWNKVDLVGQGVLAIAVIILGVHVSHWIWPQVPSLTSFMSGWLRPAWHIGVDYVLAGALGVGLYFHMSGRVWCRFACPLAALMHIYARFSKFRIVPDKKKCISCNACTTACHQGIDVMNFANKGAPMADPECVRCSACVQVCPTGVLQFGEVDRQGRVLKLDALPASPVLMREARDQPLESMKS